MRYFPSGAELSTLLDLDGSLAGEINLDDLFAKALTDPIGDFFARPRKNVRDQLVELGFMIAAREQRLANYDPEVLRRSCEILEIFHAGSLVVDDIEDGSLFRRGKQSLHSVYGLPLALNAGNWLYFLPFKLIEDMALSTERKASLARECQATLLRAHYGQALDLGVELESLEQTRVASVAMAAMELKAGVLMGLAMSMGAIALGASLELRQSLNRFGRKAGVALQMFDDIGNLTSSRNPEKKCEDLKLKRIGYIFGVASQILEQKDFRELIVLADQLPDSCAKIESLLNTNCVPELARQEANRFLSGLLEQMRSELSLRTDEIGKLEWLKSCLVKSYE